MTVMSRRGQRPIPGTVRDTAPGRIGGHALAAVLGLVVLGVSTLSGCSVFSSGDDGHPSGKGGRLAVVASFYPLQFLAEQIGGDRVQVTDLTEPGQEPHDLEISARQTARLEKSDVALYLKGLQPSVDEAIQQSTIPVKIDVTTLVPLKEHGTEVGGHATAHDDQPDEDDDTMALDPHIWLDPVQYSHIARLIASVFEKTDPPHAATYRANTEALTKRLDTLNAHYVQGLKHTDRKVFLTTHAAFGYLAERYGLTEEAIGGLDPESEPSADRVRRLQDMAKADGVTTVFYETLVSDKTARTLAGDTGLKTDVLDPIEGITRRSRGDDYLQVMESNLKALQRALGAPTQAGSAGAAGSGAGTTANGSAGSGAPRKGTR